MLVGIDYASVDGNTPPDISRWKAACTQASSTGSFAILRGAWGTTLDRTFQRDARRFADAGVVHGAYLFLRNPQAGFSASPEDQVHAFADAVGPLTRHHMVPTVDVEDASATMTPQEEIDWVHRAWLEMTVAYGVPPIIYTSDRVWREDLHNLPAGEMVDSPLWLAKPWPWRVRQPAHLSSAPFDAGKLDPPVPSPWGTGNWWIHQYQGDAYPVPGFSSTVDLSRFRVMRIGESGDRVAWVRRRMGAPGTSVFDSTMLADVRNFQSLNGLTVDGIIGPRTFAALCWSAPAGSCARAA